MRHTSDSQSLPLWLLARVLITLIITVLILIITVTQLCLNLRHIHCKNIS